MRSHGGAPRARGLFGKLLLIFGSLLVAIALSFTISFHLFRTGSHKRLVRKNIKNYATYIASEIGSPPNTVIAQQKAEELGLVIGVFSKDFQFKTSPDMPSPEGSKDLTKRGRGDFNRKHHIVVLEKDGYKYAFGIDRGLVDRSLAPFILAAILSLLAVIIAYHFVDKLFKPLQNIKQAAGEFANGNFDHSLRPTGKGILSELSQSISEMAEKIQSMLEAKRELLLAIAHELRTPITRAKLHVELIEDPELKAKITEELDEMSQQVTDILEGERLKEGYAELAIHKVDLKEIIEEVRLRNLSSEDIIVKPLQDSPVSLQIDPVKYALVIKNLLSNAVRHGQGKQVEIIFDQQSLSVIDHGPGIPKEELEHITEAFYRVEKARDRHSGGVGLGLYLVNQILQAHGHKLEVESAEVTKFTIKF